MGPKNIILVRLIYDIVVRIGPEIYKILEMGLLGHDVNWTSTLHMKLKRKAQGKKNGNLFCSQKNGNLTCTAGRN